LITSDKLLVRQAYWVATLLDVNGFEHAQTLELLENHFIVKLID
jgi:hypothetical protein